MSLFIDRRERDLYPVVCKFDVEVVLTELEFGDCMFEGLGPGPGQEQVLVGIERKKLSDLVNSMKERRLSGWQLRGMSRAYDYRVLVTEGQWRPGPAGELEEWRYDPRTKKFGWCTFYKSGAAGDRAAVSYAQLLGYLTGLELRGNVVWRRTRDIVETAAQYVALYRNFQVPWESHHSHEQVYTGGGVMPVKGHGSGWAEEHEHDLAYGKYGRGRVTCVQQDPSTLWRMAAQLPGVDRRAEAVSRHFKTVKAMAEAGVEEWMEVEGIGKKTAAAVVRAITEEGR